MKRYDRYKASGIEWIGQIPEHWGIKPIKYLLQKGKEGIRIGPFGSSLRAEFIELHGFKVYGQENIINDNFAIGWRYINSDKFVELSDYKIKSGDILITMMGTTGKCKIVPAGINEGIIDSHLIRMRVDENLFIPKLLADLINDSYYLFSQIKLMSKGSIMEGLNSGIVKNLILLIPPIEEQNNITKYLDKKTAQIDHIIRKKQRLIELLNEERTAVINNAISGEGKNWERKKLKYIVSKVGSGITPSGGANVYLQDGIPLLRSQNIYSNGLRLDDVAYISEEIDEQMSNTRIQEGDVLLNITGASIGRCFYVPKGFIRGNVNQHVCIIRPLKSEIETEYLHLFLISGIGQTLIDSCQNGANREGLNFQQIKAFVIPLPKLAEQRRVIQKVNKETQRIDNAVSKIQKEITLLQEYRTALISEVVTGKIKVA